MKNKIIIHISDLHISRHTDIEGKVITNNNSWLTTNPDDDNDFLNYVKLFCDCILENFKNGNYFLLISGDIANESDELEYDKAVQFINELTKRLKIKKEDILIVPGDHDINRFECETAFRLGKMKSNKKAWEYNKEKFKYFNSFYFNIFNKKFNFDKAIVSCLDFPEEKLVFIGLNSNYTIGFKDGECSINLNSLEVELKQIEKKYESYAKIAVFHHNIIPQYDEKVTCKWNKENRAMLFNVLRANKFECLFYGNEHTRGSGKSDSFYYSDAGSFAYKSPAPSFKVYEIKSENGNLSLKQNLFVLLNANKKSECKYGNWAPQENKSLKEEDQFELRNPFTANISHNNTPHDIPEKPISPNNLITNNTQIVSIKNNALFEIIRSKKLYHSGHFHWSETSRAHNWVNTSKLLEDNDDLLVAISILEDLIVQNNLTETIDFVIGLGIEGNLLASRIAIKYNKPYSFLPYSYRYDEHNEYEKDLNFSNEGKFKTVLIVTDAVNEGLTIRKLIHKRQENFFKDVSKIIVLSLIYTGDDLRGINILNREDIDAKNSRDHNENRIDFYYALHLKAEKCPYSGKTYTGDFRKDCLVVREGMGCVHKFYDEEKAIKKQNAKNLKH